MIVQEIRNDNVFGYVRYQGEPNRKDAVIEKLRKQGFRITKQRCILLDIILDPRTSGDASGMKFADHIREVERYHFTPIIFITGLEDPSLCDQQKEYVQGCVFLKMGSSPTRMYTQV